MQRAVRVRSHEGVPVMHLTSYVPAALGETFTAEDLNRIPLFQLLARAGAHLARGDQIVSATLADPAVASRLGVKVGAALIDLRRMMLDQQGRAVEYRRDAGCARGASAQLAPLRAQPRASSPNQGPTEAAPSNRKARSKSS